jgi:hypothetical protein
MLAVYAPHRNRVRILRASCMRGANCRVAVWAQLACKTMIFTNAHVN